MIRNLLLATALFMGCESTTSYETIVYEDTLYTTVTEYDTVVVYDTLEVDHGKHQLALKISESGSIRIEGYGDTLYARRTIETTGDVWYFGLRTWSQVILHHSDDSAKFVFDLDTIPSTTIYRVDGEWRAN